MATATRSRRRQRNRTAAILALLIEAQHSPIEIARMLKAPKSTVYTIDARRKARELAEAEAGAVQFGRVPLRRCPRHGAVYVWPCVACAAQAARQEAAARRRSRLAESA